MSVWRHLILINGFGQLLYSRLIFFLTFLCVLHRVTHVEHVTHPALNVKARDPTTAPGALFFSASQRMGGVFPAVERKHSWIPQESTRNAASATNWMVQALNEFIIDYMLHSDLVFTDIYNVKKNYYINKRLFLFIFDHFVYFSILIIV